MTSNRNLLYMLLILSLIAVVIFSTLWYFQQTPSAEQDANLDWYVRKAKHWGLQARVLRVSQVCLAMTAILASVLAASKWKPTLLPEGFLAVLAAASIALLTGLDITTQANKMRNAERLLTVAILQYRQATKPSLEILLNAYQEGEKIVGDYNPQASPTQIHKQAQSSPQAIPTESPSNSNR